VHSNTGSSAQFTSPRKDDQVSSEKNNKLWVNFSIVHRRKLMSGSTEDTTAPNRVENRTATSKREDSRLKNHIADTHH
jgi:hypothetical protein